MREKWLERWSDVDIAVQKMGSYQAIFASQRAEAHSLVVQIVGESGDATNNQDGQCPQGEAECDSEHVGHPERCLVQDQVSSRRVLKSTEPQQLVI